MAALSDQLLVITVLGYLVAMVCHAAEFAFGARASAPRVLVAVPAGALAEGRDGSVAGPPDQTPSDGRSPDRGAAARLGAVAVVSLVAAAIAHLGSVVTRGIAADRLPWGNMYEFTLASTLVGVLAWLVVLRRFPAVRHLGLYVALVNAVLLGLAGLVVYSPVAPLRAPLRSYWLSIHVTGAVVATGIFLMGFVAAGLYLIRSGHDRGRTGFPYSLGRRVPAAEALERLTFRLHAFAFPIWTFAIAAGAIWAEAAWSRYWGWDPKEVWAFISWVIYAAYLHARATPSVRRPVTAWLVVIGWASMLMNLFGVNFFFEGLHSYA